jgi:hypothetical protein
MQPSAAGRFSINLAFMMSSVRFSAPPGLALISLDRESNFWLAQELKLANTRRGESTFGEVETRLG